MDGGSLFCVLFQALSPLDFDFLQFSEGESYNVDMWRLYLSVSILYKKRAIQIQQTWLNKNVFDTLFIKQESMDSICLKMADYQNDLWINSKPLNKTMENVHGKMLSKKEGRKHVCIVFQKGLIPYPIRYAVIRYPICLTYFYEWLFTRLWEHTMKTWSSQSTILRGPSFSTTQYKSKPRDLSKKLCTLCTTKKICTIALLSFNPISGRVPGVLWKKQLNNGQGHDGGCQSYRRSRAERCGTVLLWRPRPGGSG